MEAGSVSDFIKSNAISENVIKKNNSDLSMDDFFQLMVAQLQNQDMFSPMDNTQFMNQMAQFSMVNALMDMSELSNVSYSTSLIGKQVTVAFIGDDGQMGSKTGTVEGVNLFNGSAEVVVGGQAYALSNVMTIESQGAQSANPLLDQADIIGKTAYIMHMGSSGNYEIVEGAISGLKIIDGELNVTIDGRSFPAREITALNEPAAAEAKAAPMAAGADAAGGAATADAADAADAAAGQTGTADAADAVARQTGGADDAAAGASGTAGADPGGE
ncbi:MAG: hypothetical protein LBH39_01080 [Clostridiales Family XIII bacterium]|jgi:flagellar basal-body rod modification protein FlgD|nr:hypothetical protein [Clostridiales Family XIII bacterium]